MTMTRYISVLRGINVGGKRKILMVDLKMLYEKLGFSNITTYIQSGNVFFDSDQEENEISRKIEKAIIDHYGFTVPVIIRTLAEMETIFADNPFLKLQDTNIENLHLTFLSEAPSSELLDKIKKVDIGLDKIKIIHNNAYIYIYGKFLESKISNALFEKNLKVSATNRNWRTVSKLVEIAKNESE